MNETTESKRVYFGYIGAIDSNGCARICASLNQALNNGGTEIHLAMTSLGGTVADGFFLYNHIRALPVRVIAYNTGSVSSIAVVGFVAAEERVCSNRSIFMIHPTTMGAATPSSSGALKSLLTAVLAEDERIHSVLSERTRIPDHILDARRIGDVHILPDSALEYGIVHRVGDFILPKGESMFHI